MTFISLKVSEKLVRIGEVGVDSGQVIITDPCYLDHWTGGDFVDEDKPGRPEGNDYDTACKITLSKQGAGEFNFQESGSGVASRTAYGDGSYPVYAVTSRDGTIRGLFVDFDDIMGLGEEDDDEDLDDRDEPDED